MAIVGCFVLAFGWFGFNAGSTLAGTDLRIGVVAVNTMLASAGGAFAASIYMWLLYGKPDISMAANGLLAGLVAITAPCAFVTAPVAVLIGVIAGVLLCIAVFFVERTLKIDDPVGAISVHGVNGAWGVLSLGLFADGTYGDGWNGVPGTVKGLLYGDSSQFLAQCIGTLTNIVYVAAIGYVVFKLLDLTLGLRVDPEHEFEGLDQHEVAVVAYPDFNLRNFPRSPVRMRITSSRSKTKIFPSPIFPVRAAVRIRSTTAGTISAGTAASILILGMKSTTYSAPR